MAARAGLSVAQVQSSNLHELWNGMGLEGWLINEKLAGFQTSWENPSVRVRETLPQRNSWRMNGRGECHPLLASIGAYTCKHMYVHSGADTYINRSLKRNINGTSGVGGFRIPKAEAGG